MRESFVSCKSLARLNSTIDTVKAQISSDDAGSIRFVPMTVKTEPIGQQIAPLPSRRRPGTSLTQWLRRKLQADGSRIQYDITEYAELNRQVIQVTAIIADSVKKLPVAPGIAR
jgi:hypothetical protein